MNEEHLRAMARLLGMPVSSIQWAYEAAKVAVERGATVQTKDGPRLILRTPDGHLDNCARACGEHESECQVCGGACPDRDRFEAKS